jgi:flagellar biogenesis protein FliO
MHLLPTIFACATCLPDQTTEVAKAANLAIFFMVGVVILVLSLVLKIMFNFARKQRQFSDTNS